MMALAVMQHMKMPIWTYQSHLVKQACLYTRRRHGSRNCRGGVIRSAFRFDWRNVRDVPLTSTDESAESVHHSIADKHRIARHVSFMALPDVGHLHE